MSEGLMIRVRPQQTSCESTETFKVIWTKSLERFDLSLGALHV
jgi:hypothetical protein